MAELAYVNGVWSRIDEAKVSVEDRGYQFGDGIYEVIVAYDGKPFLLQEHLQRMRSSASAIHLPYDFDANPIEPLVREALRRSELSNAVVYVQLSRGVAPRTHVIPPGLKPVLVLTVRPHVRVTDELRRRGVKVMTMPDMRWTKCYIKAITLLPNVLAKYEAMNKGFDEAVFVDDKGEVLECTASNIFIAKNGALVFPPRTEHVLHGITQSFVLECAKGIGIPIDERTFDVEALYSADEAFISSTTIEVLGVTSADGRKVGKGEIGPITQRIHTEFARRARG